MKNILLVIGIVLIPLASLNMCAKDYKEYKAKNIEYVKYFLKRELIPNENFTHINSNFQKEIKASSNEIIFKIKAIEKAKGQFYKVFYNKNRLITKYQFFKKNKIISSTVYKYGTSKEKTMKNKVRKIEHYNSKGNMIAYEIIDYSRAGRAIQSKRYNDKGNIVNLF